MDSFMSDVYDQLFNTHAVKCNTLLVLCIFLLKKIIASSLYYKSIVIVG